MNDTVSEHIDRMKVLYGVKEDQELAEKLGASKSAVANWRRRNAIPASVKEKVARQFGAVSVLGFFGEAWQGVRYLDNVHAVALHIYEDLRDRIMFDSSERLWRFRWWGCTFEEIEAGLRDHIRKELAEVETGEPLISRCIADYEAGKIEAIETLFGRGR